jgi:hypothetical protein
MVERKTIEKLSLASQHAFLRYGHWTNCCLAPKWAVTFKLECYVRRNEPYTFSHFANFMQWVSCTILIIIPHGDRKQEQISRKKCVRIELGSMLVTLSSHHRHTTIDTDLFIITKRHHEQPRHHYRSERRQYGSFCSNPQNETSLQARQWASEVVKKKYHRWGASHRVWDILHQACRISQAVLQEAALFALPTNLF